MLYGAFVCRVSEELTSLSSTLLCYPSTKLGPALPVPRVTLTVLRRAGGPVRLSLTLRAQGTAVRARPAFGFLTPDCVCGSRSGSGYPALGMHVKEDFLVSSDSATMVA